MVAVPLWFKKRKAEQPLTGAPSLPRLKTYSANSGYVYQYVFVGQRPADGGVEYFFDVSHDRKTWRRIPVFTGDAALAPWIRDHARELTNSERYAVAKIALRNAFDDRAPAHMVDRIAPGPDEVNAILDELGV